MRLLDYNDSYIRSVRHLYAADRSKDTMAQYLNEIAIAHADSFQGSLLIGRKNGTLAYYSAAGDHRHDSLVGLPYYEHFRKSPQDQLFIEPTRSGRFTKQPRFRLVRPILKHGRFDGIVMQSLNPNHFKKLFASYNLGPNSVVSLISTDHYMIARYPAPPNSVFGRGFNNWNLWRHLKKSDTGQYDARSPIDGIQRHILYMKLQNYPLVAVIGISYQDAEANLAGTKRLLNIQLAIFIISALLGCILVLTILNKNRRMAAAEEIIRDLANTDALTGAKNRRSFLALAEQEFARAKRYEQPLSVLMIDADHFKQINDTFGHMTGDNVLRRLVMEIRAVLRQIDALGRFGGEEFAILLPQTSLEDAMVVAERVRQTIEATTVETSKGPVRFTVSIGVGARTPDMGSFEHLLESADNALYQSKDGGRNRCIAATVQT